MHEFTLFFLLDWIHDSLALFWKEAANRGYPGRLLRWTYRELRENVGRDMANDLAKMLLRLRGQFATDEQMAATIQRFGGRFKTQQPKSSTPARERQCWGCSKVGIGHPVRSFSDPGTPALRRMFRFLITMSISRCTEAAAGLRRPSVHQPTSTVIASEGDSQRP